MATATPIPLEYAPAHRVRRWSTGHIPVLDGLRGVAVLAVMFHHFFSLSPKASGWVGALQRAAGVGWRGVDLFFVLSGFLITGILLDAKGSSTYFQSFYVRRVLRIFPLFYGVILLVAIGLHIPSIKALFALGGIKASLLWLCFYCNNFVMAYRHDMSAFDPLGHFWSLAVEEHFYLVWPAIVWLCSRRQLAVIALLCAAGAWVLRLALVIHTHSWVPSYILTPCRVDGLALGALLALIVRSRFDVTRVRGVAWGLMAAGFAVVFVSALGSGHFAAEGSIRRIFETCEPSGYAILFFGVMAILISAYPGAWGRRAMELKPLMSVGRYSYGMYVLHLIFMRPFTKLFPYDRLSHLLHSHNLGILAFCLLAAIATYLLAFASWNLYEKHFLRLKRFFPY